MIKRAIFHIGAPKTGTSIIQSHLAQNRLVLRERGILYPATISSDERVYRTFESHHLLTYALAGWKPFDRYSPKRFLSMARETAAEYGLETLLLSAENTYWLPRQIVGRELPAESDYWQEKRAYVEAIADFLSSWETEIVIYLRRQDRWIESWINQQVKNGNPILSNLDDFVEHNRWLMDYERHLNIWADAFGKDRIRVRAYEKEQLPGGLFQDFCETTGIGDPKDFPLKTKPRYNAQLSRDALEFLNMCNSLPMTDDQRWWLRITLRGVTGQFESQKIFNNQNLLTPKQRADLVARYEDMNARIARDYLGHAAGPLFVEPPPDPNEAWEPYPGLSTDTVAYLVTRLILEARKEPAGRDGKEAIGRRLGKRVREALEGVVPQLTEWMLARRDRSLWRTRVWDAA